MAYLAIVTPNLALRERIVKALHVDPWCRDSALLQSTSCLALNAQLVRANWPRVDVVITDIEPLKRLLFTVRLFGQHYPHAHILFTDPRTSLRNLRGSVNTNTFSACDIDDLVAQVHAHVLAMRDALRPPR